MGDYSYADSVFKEQDKTRICAPCGGELLAGMAYKEHMNTGEGYHIGCAAAAFQDNKAGYLLLQLKIMPTKKVVWQMS